jgi:drug/metabolite transporter (DMT)-like permease
MKAAPRLGRGYLICVLGTAFLSTTAIFIRYLTLTYHLPPLVLAFWRAAFVVIALLLIFATVNPARLKLGRQHLGFMVLFGLEISLFNSLWTTSVAMNGAAVATVLAYSSAAFTAILGWWLLHEHLGWIKIIAVSLSILGCVFVSGAYDTANWQVNALGILTGLLTGLTYAGYTLLGRSASQRGINSWTTLLFSFTFAVPFLLLYNQFPERLPAGVASANLFWLDGEWVGWLVLIVLAVGPTIAGFGLYIVSLSYLPASVVNIIATLEPVMTGLLAFILLGERFSGPQWIGSALILGGILIIRLSEGR